MIKPATPATEGLTHSKSCQLKGYCGANWESKKIHNIRVDIYDVFMITLFKGRPNISRHRRSSFAHFEFLDRPLRCSPFHFTKHFSPSLAGNCLRLDNSFAQQGQSSELVLLKHKSWKLQMWTWELKTIFIKNPKSRETKDNCKILPSHWSKGGLHHSWKKNVTNSTDRKLT